VFGCHAIRIDRIGGIVPTWRLESVDQDSIFEAIPWDIALTVVLGNVDLGKKRAWKQVPILIDLAVYCFHGGYLPGGWIASNPDYARVGEVG